MLKLALALVTGALCAAPAATQSITTLFTSNNGGSVGWTVFFDMNVKVPLFLTSFDLNVGDAASTPITVDVYTAPTTYLGKELTPAAWTKVSTGGGTAVGRDQPSPVDIADLLMLPGPVGICIHFVTCTAVYTNGTGTNQTYSNSEVDLQLGASTGGFFTGLLFTPRVWNGTIYYAAGQATYGSLGQGCAGSNGIPKLAAAAGSLPKIGQVLTVEVTQGPTLPAAGVMMIGFNKQTFGGVPLPFDLSQIGMPGCKLYQDAKVTVGIAMVNGKATFPMGIPNNPALVMTALQHQAAILEPGANQLGVTSSNAGEGIVGR